MKESPKKMGPSNAPMATIGAGVPNLLREALLGLNLIMLLCRHSADISRGCPGQRLHLLDGFHGDALGKHPEE